MHNKSIFFRVEFSLSDNVMYQSTVDLFLTQVCWLLING